MAIIFIVLLAVWEQSKDHRDSKAEISSED